MTHNIVSRYGTLMTVPEVVTNEHGTFFGGHWHDRGISTYANVELSELTFVPSGEHTMHSVVDKDHLLA